MPTIKDRINNELKDAMRAKDVFLVSVLRMLLSAIKDKEISMRSGDEVVFDDEKIIGIIAAEVKKRKDSVVSYKDGGREDLAEKEEKEIEVLKKYLPEELSDEEVEKIIKEVIGSLGEVNPKDFGKIMGQVSSRLKGRADGKRVSDMIKEILA